MSTAESELRRYVHDWYERFPAGDAAAMAELYTVDARLYLANLPGMRGRQAIGQLLAGIAKYGELDIHHEVTDVDMLGDALAVVTGKSRVTVRPRDGSPAVTESVRFVMVMERDPADNRWRSRYDVSQPTPDAR